MTKLLTGLALLTVACGDEVVEPPPPTGDIAGTVDICYPDRPAATRCVPQAGDVMIMAAGPTPKTTTLAGPFFHLEDLEVGSYTVTAHRENVPCIEFPEATVRVRENQVRQVTMVGTSRCVP